MVNWTDSAAKNLQNIHDYIALNSAVYAKNVVNHIYNSAGCLDQFPRKGRKLPELNRSDIREIFIYTYRIIYKIRTEDILILNLLHMKQNNKVTKF